MTKKIIKIFLILFFIFIALNIIFPLNNAVLIRPESKQITDRNGRLIRVALSKDGYWRLRMKPDEIPEIVEKSVLNFEDKYFYFHPGFNFFAIARAFVHNVFSKRNIGGSTITMQLARMTEKRRRSIVSKIIEIFRAVQIEMKYSKKEILSMYLNIAPYGGNIEGIKAAAMFYFDKKVNDLSLSELASLTVVPKNPNRNRPDRVRNVVKLKNRVLSALKKDKVISEDRYNRALKEPMTARRRDALQKYMHFTGRPEVINSKGNIIKTTLDSGLQEFVEKRLKEEVYKLRPININNAAMIVVENRTGEIVAYAGSHDFHDKRHEGQNDGVMMLRSPGSVLKPLVYAQAIRQGMITPSKMLMDIPVSIGGYYPKNYDEMFYGLVPAGKALTDSLNIPAIDLNNHLGDYSLYEMLKKSNVKGVKREKGYYASGIVIGGVELSIYDIARLYTAMATDGHVKNLKFVLDGKPAEKGAMIIDSESAYIVSDILSNSNRIELNSYWDSASDMPVVAFKTGTSSRKRDFLTVAYNPKYTAVAWFGNFNGKSAEDGTGLTIASSSVIDVFRFLEKREHMKWFDKPINVVEKEVCIDAYHLKNNECLERRKDFVIKNISINDACINHTPEKISWLLKEGYLESPKELDNKLCGHLNRAPMIASPSDKSRLIISRLLPEKMRRVIFQCYSADGTGLVYWFIDGKLTDRVKSGEKIYKKLGNGVHEIVCMDEKSANSMSIVEVTSDDTDANAIINNLH